MGSIFFQVKQELVNEKSLLSFVILPGHVGIQAWQIVVDYYMPMLLVIGSEPRLLASRY